MDDAQILATFLAQLIALMVFGRLIGEAMTRLGQPAIFGQLLAGVVLGPSLFGALAPGLHAMVFPAKGEVPKMIDAISQVGILLLLLLTGMETNVQLVRRRFHVVLATSLSGIAVPFVCGMAVGYLMPDHLVPDEGRRLVTALFIGTALSISSVKIVAMVLMEVGFIRRDLGQLILGTAILDDSLAWIIVSVIAGMAARNAIDLPQIGLSVAAALAFLAFSLTLGRRLVAALIRWSNDSLAIEFPVITAVLVVTFAMALTTDLIGVHSALGAFIAGVVIGQAPILKGHIEQELRGLILAFFSPVFFAVAGLHMDLTTLASPAMLGLALAFIAIASIGKTAGALLGGRIGGLSFRESLALATGLNARGSTEVIIATIGMSLGVLSEPLYTLIVAMAIITTMAMPPTLRWALSRVEMRPEERDRLEKEEAAEHDHLTAMERILVIADEGRNTPLTMQVVGSFAARQQLLTTILEPPAADTADAAGDRPEDGPTSRARAAAQAVQDRLASAAKTAKANGDTEAAEEGSGLMPVDTLITRKQADGDSPVTEEAAKGYSILFSGIESPFEADGHHFAAPLAGLLEDSDIPVAVLVGARAGDTAPPRRILVPTDGTQVAQLATEIGVALAGATGAGLTLLHVIEKSQDSTSFHSLLPEQAQSVLHQADVLARRNGVTPRTTELADRHPNRVIRRLASSGGYDLVVLGADLRQDGGRFLGPRMGDLIKSLDLPVLLVAL